MKSQVQKWGNSLALRIPKAVADEIGLKNATAVELTSDEGKLVVTPVAVKPRWTLKRLLARVTDANLHAEHEVGLTEGKEAW